VVLHWIINPGLAFNELVLGQTIPKVMLIEKEGERPLFQRSLIPCPHCNTLHSGLKWTAKNKTAFKNWFGIYCDHCSGIIPVQRNFDFFTDPFGHISSLGVVQKTIKAKMAKQTT
jgi:hypothetical protein